MPSVEMLVLLYALGGVAVWTRVLRDHHPRARRRVGSRRWLRRRRVIVLVGVSAMGAVTLTAATLGFVEGHEIALAVGVLVLGVQGVAVASFSERLLSVESRD